MKRVLLAILLILAMSSQALAIGISDSTNSATGKSSTTDSLNKSKQVSTYGSQNTLGLPVGTVIAWPSDQELSSADSGKYLECDGKQFNKDAYPELFAVLNSDRVPDLNGRFLRGTVNRSSVLNRVEDSLKSLRTDIAPHTHGQNLDFSGKVSTLGDAGIVYVPRLNSADDKLYAKTVKETRTKTGTERYVCGKEPEEYECNCTKDKTERYVCGTETYMDTEYYDCEFLGTYDCNCKTIYETKPVWTLTCYCSYSWPRDYIIERVRGQDYYQANISPIYCTNRKSLEKYDNESIERVKSVSLNNCATWMVDINHEQSNSNIYNDELRRYERYGAPSPLLKVCGYGSNTPNADWIQNGRAFCYINDYPLEIAPSLSCSQNQRDEPWAVGRECETCESWRKCSRQVERTRNVYCNRTIPGSCQTCTREVDKYCERDVFKVERNEIEKELSAAAMNITEPLLSPITDAHITGLIHESETLHGEYNGGSETAPKHVYVRYFIKAVP